MYAGFYVCLEKKAGSVAAPLCVLCWVQSTLLASRLGFSLSWKGFGGGNDFEWKGHLDELCLCPSRDVRLWFVCWLRIGFLSSSIGLSGDCHALVVLAAQLFCWTGQFIGHGVFEKRAPALLDNLVQAFLIGPFFVLLECLQLVFGYEPYQGFHASVEEKIEAQIKEWQDKKQKKIT